MKQPPVALQLYTVRDAAKKDYAGVVKEVSAIGYAGVEPAGYPGTSPKEAGKLFRDLGLNVPSAHTGMPVGDDKQRVLDEMAAIGSKRIISGLGPDSFKTMDGIKKSCDLFNEAGDAAAGAGLSFGIHNHWWEFLKVDGRYVYQIMAELLSPKVFFQIDTYWVQTAGPDPAAVVRELGKRAPLLHLKDGPCERGKPMTAVGDGKLDFPSIVKAGEDSAEWLIVELDACATDMMEAVRKSYAYLTKNKLGKGK